MEKRRNPIFSWECDPYTLEFSLKPVFMPVAIKDLLFFENEDYIIARKPAGLVSEEDSAGSENLRQLLEAYVRETYPWKKQLICQLVHRLDKPVGGLLVCAKKQSILKELHNQFHNRTVKKFYLAIVEGNAEPLNVTLKHFLKKSDKQYKAIVVSAKTPGAKEAVLSYRVLSWKQQLSFLMIELRTGKFHQIRAQLSHIGLPIWNDFHYGAPISLPEGNRIGLYSCGLQFYDPKTKKKQTFVSIPELESEPWNIFKEEIEKAASELFSMSREAQENIP